MMNSFARTCLAALSIIMVAHSVAAQSGVKSPNSKWVIDTGQAPGNIPGVNEGTFSADNVDFVQGVMRLKLTQTGSAPVQSVGAEVRSVGTYGYGTYEWTIRTSSTATTPYGAGDVVSGQISSGFTFINNSQTEIDFEIEGQNPDTVWMTNWNGINNKDYSSAYFANPDQGFHKYKFVWSPGRIDFYLDGSLVSTHTQNIPSAPAYIMANHWGTNSTGWGGLATVGVTRYMYISRFTFKPAH